MIVTCGRAKMKGMQRSFDKILGIVAELEAKKHASFCAEKIKNETSQTCFKILQIKAIHRIR